MEGSRFTSALLRWFSAHGRELPWRETRDPYAIWLSEVILQQTRIQQGWEYWERFMRRWPTVDLLAEATEDEVLREWQGLGYYSRARNLHYAARQIVELGRFPDTYEAIRKLKGVGDYTAAAIASFAFGLRHAVVDGNVYRVLSRYFGIDTPINTTEGKKIFAAIAQSLLPGSDSVKAGTDYNSVGTYNQAIMDFGALQCTPQSPHCGDCPLLLTCEAKRTGHTGDWPVKVKTLKVRERHLTYIYIRYRGKTAIRKRPVGDIWAGLWEPPCADEGELPLSGITHLAGRRLMLRQGVRHVLTHRILLADFYLAELEEKPSLPEGYIWIREEDIDNYGVPRLVELLLDAVSSHDAAADSTQSTR